MSGGGSSNSGSSQTVTQTQQIPQFEQDFSQANQNLAASLGSTPYPNYQSQLIAPINATQWAALQDVGNVANSYLPNLNAAQSAAGAASPLTASNENLATYINRLMGGNTGQLMSAAGGEAAQGGSEFAMGAQNASLNPANASTVESYMSPYIQAALAPQLLQAQTQLGQQQQQINTQATQAGAFGDARQGVENALQNYYGGQTMAGIESQGYNTAFNNALSAIQQQEALGNQQMSQGGNLMLGGTGLENSVLTGQEQVAAGQQQYGLQQQQEQLAQSQQLASLAQQFQDQGLTANQALFAAGQFVQNQTQAADTAEYQQFLNQVNWPYQQLSVRESALSNSPYNLVNAVTLPGANSSSQGISALMSMLGLSGSQGTQGTGLSPAKLFT